MEIYTQDEFEPSRLAIADLMINILRDDPSIRMTISFRTKTTLSKIPQWTVDYTDDSGTFSMQGQSLLSCIQSIFTHHKRMRGEW